MKNAEKLREIFGIYATEMWVMPESEFLEWLNSEYNDQPLLINEERKMSDPVNNSRWIYGEDVDGNDGYFCEECGEHVKWDYRNDDINFIEKYEYCPYCGRKMERKGESENV